MKEIVFNPEFGEIRIEMYYDNPIFCAPDICRALELSDPEVALRKLDDDEKLIRKVYASGQTREMLFVTESGLYTLIMRSNKPNAKKFRRWVTGDVLPSIRQHGYYVHPSMVNDKTVKKLTKEMITHLERYVFASDVEKLGKKFGKRRNYVQCVMSGSIKDNEVMQALQARAIANKKNEIDAYHIERVREVIGKLGAPAMK